MKKKKKWTRVVDRRMRDYGEIDYSKRKIRIDSDKLKKGGVTDTVMHEELHRKHPEMTEKKIRKLTKKKLKKISLRKLGNMLRRYKEKPKKKVSHYRTN